MAGFGSFDGDGGDGGFDGFVASSGFDGFDGFAMDWWRRVASIAPVMTMVLRASLTLEAQRITNVNDFLLLRSWASTKIGELLKRDAQKPTVPRVTDGSRSPRRVDKIDGERVEALSTIGCSDGSDGVEWLRMVVGVV